MKKKAIVLLAFTAALTAVSCQKEAMKEAETTPTGEGMTISAVSEGIGAEAKAAMVYKYDVVWKTGDKICVKNSEKSVEFTLTGGEETTKGTFSSGESISGDVEGFYPSSIVTDGGLVWPAEQGSKQICPMYCKKNLSSTQNQTFNFASLGSVLQLTFSTTSSDIVLKSIEVKADEAMSGAFTVENGQAKVSQPEGDKPGITLDLGDEGVKVGVTAKKFNIAVPAGEYHGLSIVFTATDGKKCTINAKKDKAIEIVFNTVNTLAVSGKFRPAGALPGVFTVADPDGKPDSGDEKQVYFSKGNLYYDGNKFDFEDEQYYFRTYDGKGKCDANGYDKNSGTASGHWGLFGWSTTNNNYGMSISEDSSDYSGDFVDWGTAVDDKNTWRTLSTAEWQYLFNYGEYENNIRKDRYKWATVNGVNGYVIAPDNVTLQEDKTSYTETDLNDANLVFLPAAGDRYGSSVYDVGNIGSYWSSTAIDEDGAYNVGFISTGVYPDGYGGHTYGYSVRLITESK